MKYTKEMANLLNKLLQLNYDSEKGFRNAADDVKNEELKAFFKKTAQQRYDACHELRTEIRNYGEPPTEGSSIEADAHRTWMDLKSALTGNSEKTVLQEAERGEKTAGEDYNEILEQHNFPPSTENMLKKQRDAIQATIKEIERLKEVFS